MKPELQTPVKNRRGGLNRVLEGKGNFSYNAAGSMVGILLPRAKFPE